MNNWQSEGYAPSLTDCAYAFLLPGNFSFDAACANEVSASKQASRQSFNFRQEIQILFDQRIRGVFVFEAGREIR